MKKIIALFFLVLPMLALTSTNAQNLKIKNGTEYTFTEVQMNYEEHSTGNLLDKYNGKKPLEPGQTLSLPNCKTFGAGDPLEFNISATDTDDDIYVFGEVDICKTREVVITIEHLIQTDDSGDSDEPVVDEAENQAAYQVFQEFANTTFVPAIKSGMMTKVKVLLEDQVADGSNVSIAESEGFKQAELLKAKAWLAASNIETLPNATMEMAKPLSPTIFIGKNYGEDEEKGYYFVFNQQEDGSWKVNLVMDQDAYGVYASTMSEDDDEGEGEDSEMIYFMSNTEKEFETMIKERDKVNLRKMCMTKQLGDTLVGALDFLNDNIEHISADRSGESTEVNGKEVTIKYTIEISTPENANGEATGYTFYFTEDENGDLKIAAIIAAG